MRFEDRQLVQLASESTRAAFFDSAALERIALASYVIDAGTLDAPWSAAFDELAFTTTLPSRQSARIETRWDASSMRAEGMLDLESQDRGLSGVSAVWRGAVIGRGMVGGGRVDDIAGGFPSLAEVDAAIDSGAAPPPASGPARDAARRDEVALRLANAIGRPNTVSGADVATLVADEGAADIASFLDTGHAARKLGALSVRFASDAPAAPVPVRLELTAAILIFDPGASGFLLADTLRATQRAQDLLSGEASSRNGTAGLRRRIEISAIWIVPAAWFNDADWPGATAAARLAEASTWLRAYGIAVVSRA
ncbi:MULTISPECIES: hypothetical protein [unclassified Sinorhizobium]|uniref:hypothetical protein n=1 Tax=unclassified Sinorhizobium TaxID=2613772 RepID=UPI0024C24E6C|nr:MULTISPECIES: hypothetical protein [unclassified Sinorhizobium]MDK1376438.1 hypothetical protein [Sinorhizobium sp. 6-70]MDK1479987.1 hypothetical protein [Sinorhizobium sp. 6-117]